MILTKQTKYMLDFCPSYRVEVDEMTSGATRREVDRLLLRPLHMAMRSMQPGGHPPRQAPGKDEVEMNADIDVRIVQKLSCFDPCLRCLCSINAHPRLLDKAKKLLHVRTPVVHDIFRATLITEVHNTCWPVYACPDRASHDESTKRFLCLFRGEVEKGGQARECDAGIIFCDDSDILMARDENKSNTR